MVGFSNAPPIAAGRLQGTIECFSNESMPMQPRHFHAILYSAKTATAAAAAALIYEVVRLPGSAWVAAVSAVLVTLPSLDSSLRASLLRVTANLAGAFVGAVLGISIGQPVVAMAVGVMLTGLIGYLLKQDDLQRPAFVAVILVTLIGEDDIWDASLNRVAGVVIGCLCALVVGFLFDKLSSVPRLLKKEDGAKHDAAE
jgi:uncharacterized membrane protein YgaE (UPF0421/DUF939 family)